MKRKDPPSVTMPNKGIIRRHGPAQTVYIYYTLRAYRNKKGRPTSETALIGKLAPDGISLVPNSRYFELFPRVVPPASMPVIDDIRSNGITRTFEALADSMGLTSCLKQAFPAEYRAVMTASIYMAECGNVMAYIDDWLDVTDAPDRTMTSQGISRLFAGITPVKRKEFLGQWVKEHSDIGHIAYDVTSISTHSDALDMAEWGHNRDGESLAQLNVGMFYGITNGIPLYYSLYNGSICDKSHLPYMMGDAIELGIDNVEYVFDKGFVTEENLAHMEQTGMHFLAPCPPSRKDAKALIARIGAKVKDPANWICDEECYGMRTEFNLLGQNLLAHVFYDSARFADRERALYTYISKLAGELQEVTDKRIAKRYRDFFVFQEQMVKSAPLVFIRNEEAISSALAEAGFAVFITNDDTLSPRDVLKLYRRRDEVEKAFDDLKNGIDFKRFKTHTQQTTDGKTFVGFIALILRSHILNLLQKNQTTKDMALTKALLELRKLRYVITATGEKHNLLVTKTQTIIANALGLSFV